MSPLVILGITVAAPIIIAIVLRVNAAVLFMSICVGEILVQYLSGNNTTLPYVGHFDSTSLQIGLLFLPAALTSVFMLHSVKGSKNALNLLPAIAAGLLAAFLLVPLLPGQQQMQITNLSWWSQVQHWQPTIIAAGAGVSLIFLWLQRRGINHGKHHGKH